MGSDNVVPIAIQKLTVLRKRQEMKSAKIVMRKVIPNAEISEIKISITNCNFTYNFDSNPKNSQKYQESEFWKKEIGYEDNCSKIVKFGIETSGIMKFGSACNHNLCFTCVAAV